MEMDAGNELAMIGEMILLIHLRNYRLKREV